MTRQYNIASFTEHHFSDDHCQQKAFAIWVGIWHLKHHGQFAGRPPWNLGKHFQLIGFNPKSWFSINYSVNPYRIAQHALLIMLKQETFELHSMAHHRSEWVLVIDNVEFANKIWPCAWTGWIIWKCWIIYCVYLYAGFEGESVHFFVRRCQMKAVDQSVYSVKDWHFKPLKIEGLSSICQIWGSKKAKTLNRFTL